MLIQSSQLQSTTKSRSASRHRFSRLPLMRTVLSVTTMFADKPHRLNGRTSGQRFCVLTILPPVTALAVGLPAQRAIAQRFRALAYKADVPLAYMNVRYWP